ncbi:MAG TPA: helix-turn-helix transcriptional regulator [Pyrinomonadaceae bacterium]|jgi:transcriptional regulator with XRE-family HTH domain
MGSARRPQPERLALKLLQIRKLLNLTQKQMAERLRAVKSPPRPAHISRFENGMREPSLLVLLEYAHLAGVYVDVLIDDGLDLPDKLPAKSKSKSI